MSRSPRRSLRRALDSLEDALHVMEEHPDARAEVTAVLGEDLVRELEAGRDALRQAVGRLGGTGGGDSVTGQ